MLNLIVNAAHTMGQRKARPGTGQQGHHQGLHAMDGESVELRIGDNGTGIPPAIQARIYEPFFTTKPIGRGTGQGLAIVQTIITQRHRSTIRFETEPGRGTTFIVRLPLTNTDIPASSCP